MNRHRAPRGFSLIELIVSIGVTAVLAGAVSMLLVGAAGAAQRRRAGARATTVATTAAAVAATDVRAAATGFEGAAAVQIGGAVLPLVTVTADGLTVLRGALPAAEVEARVGAIGYRVTAVGGLRVGAHVAAIGQAARPSAAPLPVGTVAGLAPVAGGTMVMVAWKAPEEALLELWGEPRALLGFDVRDYRLRHTGRGELVRRDNARTWQPVIDGLRSFAVTATPCRARIVATAGTPHGIERRREEWVRRPCR